MTDTNKKNNSKKPLVNIFSMNMHVGKSKKAQTTKDFFQIGKEIAKRDVQKEQKEK